MKIKAKGISAEIEIEFSTPNDQNTLHYYNDKVVALVNSAKESVIEIETKLFELNKKSITSKEQL